MTTIHRAEDGKYLAFTKGAVEVLVEKSVNILESGEFKKIDRGKILKAGEKMAADGLRVLAVSMKKMETAATDDAETGLTLLGLIGLMDPVRPGAQEAVSICKTAGIKPVMITGDHLLTARSIARRLGIIEDDAKAGITGAELERLSLEELEERVEKITVYARVAPEQKLKIVRALQGRGQFVAMTGDGVNDAPALKRADIGVAMGITGTDVSKEAAHMILLDDNFSTIVGAVKQGRLVYDNIRKFIKYLLSTNSGELWTIFIASITALPMPLLPIQILWINLVTDGLPALALSAEPPEEDLLKRPPRHPQESIFAHGLVAHALWVGLLMGFMTIFTQVWALGKELTHWQTMTFTVLCLSQIGHALAIRSERESLFTRGFLSNKSLVGALILTFALQMAIVYVPALNPVFKTAPLTARELVIALALSSVVFFAVEAEKLLRREKWKK
jgi:Ca2+-transporting ATPase